MSATTMPAHSALTRRPVVGVCPLDAVFQQVAGLRIDADFVRHAAILDVEGIVARPTGRLSNGYCRDLVKTSRPNGRKPSVAA